MSALVAIGKGVNKIIRTIQPFGFNQKLTFAKNCFISPWICFMKVLVWFLTLSTAPLLCSADVIISVKPVAANLSTKVKLFCFLYWDKSDLTFF